MLGILSGMIDKKRPMDNMALSFDTPQEDELATNVLSGGISPYMPLVFMQQETSYRPYFSFATASKQDKASWTDSFLFFLRKLTVHYGLPLSLHTLILYFPCPIVSKMVR